ncbi:cyclopropane-fatty-acyl-phospholipid synthase family protein [Pseudoruegeria sp. HB172150]|uniref:SAM-dependent methyltransferase n=1 Tax=Pseudoruegeria sp. HB172150 TaxID=2721164 RepID=UPI001554AB94|nr:cyclopropane-fatty-acyl-phospholipid synthase family protein [Pseudoruegeria sp. HB172150]
MRHIADRRLKSEFLQTCERISEGQLTLRTPEGEIHHFGSTGPETDMDIRDWSAVSAIAAHGQIGLGESYVQGYWDTSSVEGLITLAMRNRERMGSYDSGNMLNIVRNRLIDTLLRANSRRGARRNIRAHYDVGNEFYQLWLDDGMTYSSALFQDGADDLSTAQRRKNDRILSRLTEGERVLEIGCGWGGFAEHAAEDGRNVTGVTISPSQHGYAAARLDGRADIRLCDYRDTGGRYDNLVSIEMVEAVGQRYWPMYFATLKNRLAEGGRAMVQAITVSDAFFDNYRSSSDYIRKYVFPGGMLLSDRNIAEQARAAGLKVNDSFAFGQDYGRTCRIWADRLCAKKPAIRALGHDDAFFRNWRYYLESCAASFAIGHTDIVQVELAHA